MKILYFLILSTVFISSGCFKQSPKDDKTQNGNYTISKKSEASLQNFVNSNSELIKNLDSTEWEKLRWVSKILVFLRGGQGLQANEDIKPYLNQTNEEIVDQLIAGKEFSESVFLYNLYIIGGHISNLRNGDSWNEEVFSFQEALRSAIAVEQDGDYFDYFNLEKSFYMGKLGEPFFTDTSDLPENQEEWPASPQEIREHNYKAITKKLTALIDYIESQPEAIDLKELCTSDHVRRAPSYESLGLNLPIHLIFSANKELFSLCDGFSTKESPTAPKSEAIKAVNQVIARGNKFIEFTKSMEDFKPSPDLQKLKKVNYSEFNLDINNPFFPNEFIFELQNSSTNLNRKRASYILDKFLCDDLVPIDVELPEEHKGDRHGSDPACYSCHYRLDPMAGFFKDLGSAFINYADEEFLFFDDGARVKKSEYDKNWLAPDSSNRKWNIGVIKSESNSTLNYYGENYQDLFKLLKTVPEVKQCMVKRMFQFVTSKNQNVDQEFLNNISKEFIAKSAFNSTDAIKYLFKSMALSKTFSTSNPETSKCYDKSGENNENSPPCEVSFFSRRTVKPVTQLMEQQKA